VTAAPETCDPAVTFQIETVRVPPSEELRVNIWIATPSTVIAPGVNEDEFCPEVPEEAEPARLSRNDAALTTLQVLVVVKFPVAADKSVAIILL
jgi:hypothetical protein